MKVSVNVHQFSLLTYVSFYVFLVDVRESLVGIGLIHLDERSEGFNILDKGIRCVITDISFKRTTVTTILRSHPLESC